MIFVIAEIPFKRANTVGALHMPILLETPTESTVRRTDFGQDVTTVPEVPALVLTIASSTAGFEVSAAELFIYFA